MWLLPSVHLLTRTRLMQAVQLQLAAGAPLIVHVGAAQVAAFAGVGAGADVGDGAGADAVED